jgi:hypothetical protein
MSRFDVLKEESLAVPLLASYLNQGNLTLFLGAGVSYDFGLPGWLDLVNGLRKKQGLNEMPSSATSADLQIAVDEVKDHLGSEEKLIEATREQLYITLRGVDIQNLLKNPLLMAIAALLMGGQRGRIRRVITLNYDNLLQWTLSVFGFSVHTVHKLPALDTGADVTIYHPHGYLPIPGSSDESSDFIILGKESINLRLGSPDDLWFEMVRHLLSSSICLFVGVSPISLSDAALAPLFNTIGKRVEAERPLGSWIVKQKDSLHSAKVSEFQRYNIYPLLFNDPEQISVFLFEICKKAGESMRK